MGHNLDPIWIRLCKIPSPRIWASERTLPSLRIFYSSCHWHESIELFVRLTSYTEHLMLRACDSAKSAVTIGERDPISSRSSSQNPPKCPIFCSYCNSPQKMRALQG